MPRIGRIAAGAVIRGEQNTGRCHDCWVVRFGSRLFSCSFTQVVSLCPLLSVGIAGCTPNLIPDPSRVAQEESTPESEEYSGTDWYDDTSSWFTDNADVNVMIPEDSTSTVQATDIVVPVEPVIPTFETPKNPGLIVSAFTVCAPTYRFCSVTHLQSDADGNLYTFGTAKPWAAAAPRHELFVSKRSADGTEQWIEFFSTGFDNKAAGIIVDSSGYVYLAGNVAGKTNDIWLAKLNNDGVQLWSEHYNESNEQFVAGIQLDLDGSIIVAGHGAGEGYLRGYDPISQTLMWTEVVPDVLQFQALAERSGLLGAIATPAVGIPVSPDELPVWLGQWNNNRELQWSSSQPSIPVATPSAILIDDEGNTYASGHAITKGSTISVQKYGPAGVEHWNRSLNVSSSLHSQLHFDKSDNVVAIIALPVTPGLEAPKHPHLVAFDSVQLNSLGEIVNRWTYQHSDPIAQIASATGSIIVDETKFAFSFTQTDESEVDTTAHVVVVAREG